MHQVILFFLLLTYCIDEIKLNLNLIVNDSFLTAVYPTNLKIANTVAIHIKKGLSYNPTSYRPILLLSGFSKILGKLMHKRLA